MKYIVCVFMCLAFAKAILAQTPQVYANIATDEQNKKETIAALLERNDSVKPVNATRFLIDGVAGVIGDYVILDSDIAKQIDVIKRNGNDANLSRCELIESLLQEKMYAHHAIQDSITVSDAEIEGRTENQIDYFRQGLGSDEAVARYYKRDDIGQVRDELNRINRDGLLSQRMQQRLTENVEITPEEVRQFYYGLAEEDRPLFSTEVEMSQIVVEPEPTKEAIQEAIDKLNSYRDDVLQNGADFAAKATLYSDDTGTERQGGVLTMRRGDPFVKEFKDQAFSLHEGEISEPFATLFGWHILYVEKVRGQVRDVRHILLKPYISTAQINKARAELDQMRDRIILGDISFGDAAREISDEEETSESGGQLTNPNTGDVRLEVLKLPSELASQIQFLEKGDVSGIIEEKDKLDNTVFKMIYIKDKILDHKADYVQDYLKIKDLALKKKQVEAIKKWQWKN